MAREKLKILRLQLETNSSSAPYNNFTLNTRDKYSIYTISYTTAAEILQNDASIIDSQKNILKYIQNIARVIKTSNIDIVHIHSVHPGVFFIIYCLFTLKFGILKKSIITIHNSYENYSFRNKILYSVNFIFIAKVVYCSSSSFKSFPKFFTNITKSTTINNGVNLSEIRKIPGKDFSDKKIDVVFVGRFVDVKNIHNTVMLLSKFNNLKIHFVGDGPYFEEISKKYENRNFVFHGRVKRRKVYEILANSKYFISLSKTEGLPIALLEAISLGCIPIVSDINPHREILTNEEPFIELDLQMEEQHKKIKTIIENKNHSSQEHLKKIVYEKFALNEMLSHYDSLYKSIIK